MRAWDHAAPTDKGITLTKVQLDDIPCEWVLAPGADPELRLLYLHGGGFVSGSGGFYLTLAAHLSAAARCRRTLARLSATRPSTLSPGDLRIVSAHEWLLANGPEGPRPPQPLSLPAIPPVVI